MEGDAGSALATADGAADAPAADAEGDAGSAVATADGEAAALALDVEGTAVGLYVDATAVGAGVAGDAAEAVAAAQTPRPATTATEGPRMARARRRDRLIIRVLPFWGDRRGAAGFAGPERVAAGGGWRGCGVTWITRRAPTREGSFRAYVSGQGVM